MRINSSREFFKAQEVPDCACGGRTYLRVMSGVYRRQLNPPFPFELLACEYCGLRRGWPVPSPDLYERGEAPYSAQPPGSMTWADSILRDVMCDVPRGRFLDIGCNNGDTVATASLAGFEAEGIDIDPVAVATGQAAGRPVRCVRIEDIRGEFDAIVLNHVLEHVLDLPDTLESIARVLADDGRCFIYVPNHQGLIPRLMGDRWMGWLPEQHVWHFSPATLRAAIENSPLELCRLTTNGIVEPVDGHHRLSKRFVIRASRSMRWGDQIEAVLRHERQR
jgi:SAM-dependent methyltransferase